MNPEDYADILDEYGNESKYSLQHYYICWFIKNEQEMTPELHSLNAV